MPLCLLCRRIIRNVLFKAEGAHPSLQLMTSPVGISEEEMLKIMVEQFDKEMQESGVAKTVQEKNLNMRDVVNMATGGDGSRIS